MSMLRDEDNKREHKNREGLTAHLIFIIAWITVLIVLGFALMKPRGWAAALWVLAVWGSSIAFVLTGFPFCRKGKD